MARVSNESKPCLICSAGMLSPGAEYDEDGGVGFACLRWDNSNSNVRSVRSTASMRARMSPSTAEAGLLGNLEVLGTG